MVVCIADIALLPTSAINIIPIQVEGQADACTDNVAAKGDIYIDHIVAVILDSDFGVPVAVRVGASLPCGCPNQSLVAYVRFHVEFYAGLDFCCACGKDIAVPLDQLGIEATGCDEGLCCVCRRRGGLDGEHIVGL